MMGLLLLLLLLLRLHVWRRRLLLPLPLRRRRRRLLLLPLLHVYLHLPRLVLRHTRPLLLLLLQGRPLLAAAVRVRLLRRVAPHRRAPLRPRPRPRPRPWRRRPLRLRLPLLLHLLLQRRLRLLRRARELALALLALLPYDAERVAYGLYWREVGVGRHQERRKLWGLCVCVCGCVFVCECTCVHAHWSGWHLETLPRPSWPAQMAGQMAGGAAAQASHLRHGAAGAECCDARRRRAACWAMRARQWP